MATNKALKEALLDLLKITPQGLSWRVQQKKKLAPMSTEDAVYLIAHESGLKVDKFLTSDQVDRIRHLHVNGSGRTMSVITSKTNVKRNPRGARDIRFPNEFKVSDPLLIESKLAEAKAMAALYPLLYVLENSMRQVVLRVMRAHFGEDWWETRMTRGKLKSAYGTVADRMSNEKKKSWHQRRGSHPIDYTDMTHLESIILSHQDRFIPDIIPEREWFIQFMKELVPSRNVLCHMNPLDDIHMADLRVRVSKWANVVKNALDRIPE